MTKDKNLKRLAHERAERTGESYSTARQQLEAKRVGQPDGRTISPGRPWAVRELPLEESEWVHEPPPGQHVVDWLTGTLTGLVGELRARGPDAPSYTWHPTNQTVGFWYRRMAHETVVHRIDAELGAGYTSPVDHEFALDGIDEMLVAFLAGPWWETDPVPTASGRTVAVRAGGQLWRITLDKDAVRVSRAEGPADATVEGEPFDILMWAWRREPGSVTVDGDAAGELHERLAHFT